VPEEWEAPLFPHLALCALKTSASAITGLE
jgi:hypothetical protein